VAKFVLPGADGRDPSSSGSTLRRWDPKRGVRPARLAPAHEAGRRRKSTALTCGLVLSVRILDRIRGYLHCEKSRGVDPVRLCIALGGPFLGY
jgi:hypothetical protein